MSSSTESSPYPPVRRIVTGHDSSGKSIFLEDKIVPAHTFSENSTASFTGLYRHDEFPASNQDTPGADGKVAFNDLIATKPKELVTPTGSTLWAVDTPPHNKSPFHRTESLDYGIVAKGTITLILDDGERVKLSAGDVIIQRGTIHEWINEGDEWSRVYFVMIASEKVKIGDKELGTEFH
ncbi:hypothetical protein SCHPADRAFT_917046 [Schizopora paradoxa]|uniref:Cupin type-2 domain-containing protein n=1 Tax=Schizopora paradoxa TaxID=27342 RepID=A0A0H2R883_9AGAM|nr:hypothetical protein SCHPADRAFT_917046 [Schizopora paradoxa]